MAGLTCVGAAAVLDAGEQSATSAVATHAWDRVACGVVLILLSQAANAFHQMRRLSSNIITLRLSHM